MNEEIKEDGPPEEKKCKLDVLSVIPSGAPPTNNPNNEGGQLSKRAQKRLQKRQQYLEQQKEKKKLKREKLKEKNLERRNQGLPVETYSNRRKVLKKTGTKMSDSACKVGVIVDFSFNSLMNQRDMGKALKQLMAIYCLNRRLQNPLQFHISSFTGICEKEMEKNDGYKNWDCKYHDQHFSEVFPKDKIVYLSSDSDNVITKLQDDTFYVIGGLVDHNLHKGVCHKSAVEHGVKHARLPIDEFIKMKTRKVLTINHVFHILALVTEKKSWKEAFLEVLPERKGITPLKNTEDDKDSDIETTLNEESEKDEQ